MNPVRIIVGAALAGGVAIFGAVNAFEDETQRNESGQITTAGGLGAFVIRVGDCVQLPDDKIVVSVEAVPCSDPHDAQAYSKFDISGVTTYDMDAVGTRADAGCLDRWHDAIGTVFLADADHDLYLFAPTAQSWQVGNREVVCFITSVDGSRLRGSIPLG